MLNDGHADAVSQDVDSSVAAVSERKQTTVIYESRGCFASLHSAIWYQKQNKQV